MKILLGLLIVLDLAVLAFLIYGVYILIKSGGKGGVMFPNLGIVLALPFVLAVIFIIELILIAATFSLYQYLISNPTGLL